MTLQLTQFNQGAHRSSGRKKRARFFVPAHSKVETSGSEPPPNFSAPRFQPRLTEILKLVTGKRISDPVSGCNRDATIQLHTPNSAGSSPGSIPKTPPGHVRRRCDKNARYAVRE